MGANFVRLGVMWPGVEPTLGQFNDTYLQVVRGIIATLGDRDIYVLLDFHQDLFATSLCGEGFPLFATNITTETCNSIFSKVGHVVGACKSLYNDYGVHVDPSGMANITDCLRAPFGLLYATPEVSSAFESFYRSPALQDLFVRYWTRTVAALAAIPTVIGIDIINEPWPGDVWDHPSLLIPGRTDRLRLQPLYQRVASAVHQTTQLMASAPINIFYEPTPFPDSILKLVSPIGFNALPGPAEASVLSYHVYCCTQGEHACDHDGNPLPSTPCDAFNSELVNKRADDARRLGGGAFLTEFGACTHGEQCVREIHRTAAAADEHFHSWAYWQYKFYDDVTTQSGPTEGLWDASGALIKEKYRALSRTYAQAIAGVPKKMTFDPTTAMFSLVYIHKKAAGNAPTQIYFHSTEYYDGAPEINCSPAGVTCSDVTPISQGSNTGGMLLSVAADVADGTTVEVSLARKTPPQQ
eukprot:CAMPEP_0177635792 /NCGR_PEP_ID=MMETSP0447-20121125/4095_1 /TAXON_ID=0 /ORGANISM="Stygamoeba regulata, Strain BSH-02190019" /LENGTH=467 /DNA_ID=CAMNT_0019137613 /DNA_START=462 /DNA_END=1865 /DNA_ORIENTATION=+